MASLMTSKTAIYSATVEDCVIVVCFFKNQETGQLANIAIWTEVDLRVFLLPAQSASV